MKVVEPNDVFFKILGLVTLALSLGDLKAENVPRPHGLRVVA